MPSAPKISFADIKPEDLSIPHSISVNPQTGAANIQVNIPLTGGRSGFQPALSLAYTSSGRNSAYGIGWALTGVPAIGISMKDGFPKYDGSEKYAFGGQELVPWLEGGHPRTEENDQYWIQYYRTKVEGAFNRFEKWIRKSNRSVHWRIRNPKNQVMIFGKDERGSSRIYDPQHPDHIFLWLLEAQFDNLGNAIHYEYIAEDDVNVNAGSSFERNRILNSRGFAQRYLKRIRYGNTIPLQPDDPDPEGQQWPFEVLMDYGEHGTGDFPSYLPIPSWPVRLDPFSIYQPGFEVRTYRLCRRILMYHHFAAELGDGPTLIGKLDLDYHEDAVGTTLEGVHYTGYRRNAEQDTYQEKSLPPLLFHYSEPQVERIFHPAPEQTTENVPFGLGGLNHKWVDLYGEGLPGVLYESNQAWYYKSNLGEGHLGKQETVISKPSFSFGNYALSDFDSDGNLNVVVMQGREAGYYEYDRDQEAWSGFRSFAAAPQVGGLEARTQFIDMTGDGRADLVCVKQDRITWYPSKGKEGFAAPVEIAKPVSNGVSRLPTLGANPILDYFFADMTGDSLPDQVRVQNGRVEYWPNLGNGQFGEGIVMEDAPALDVASQFDASRIRLVDLDGNGTADLLYLGRGEIRYWINASGNRFVEGGTIRNLPYIDNLSSAQILDFLGDGTPCLVWSTGVSSHADDPIHFLRLTNGVKPRLLLSSENSIGQETRLHYGYSAQHYLRDKQEGRGWITKLPSHSTVVDRLEIIDNIGNTRFESIYAYHDGFFDGEEREFRGFGLIDRYDSDVYRGTSSIPEIEFTDPVCVRTWFHNGAPGWEQRRSRDYYQGDGDAHHLPGHEIEDLSDLGPEEFNDAFRALAGQTIRTEVYGLNRDGERRENPYQVSQNRFFIRRVQSRYREHDACFAAFPRESLTYQYEEISNDPRINHSFTLQIDNYGHPVRSAVVAYPRRTTSLTEQQQFHIHLALNTFVHFDERDRYELGVALAEQAYELAGIRPATGEQYFSFLELEQRIGEALGNPVAFHQPFTSGPESRLLRWTQSYYWNDARSAALPWGGVGSIPLLHHAEAACFDDAFLVESLGTHNDPTRPESEGFYVAHDGYWWLPGQTFFYRGTDSYYFLDRQTNPDGGFSQYEYDAPYFLNLTGIADAIGNSISAEIDYHLMAPYQITDANGNISEVIYDPLGVIVVSSTHGDLLSEGGSIEQYGHEPLAGYVPQPDVSFDLVLNESARFLQGAATFLFYELGTWLRDRLPLRRIALAREEWVHDGKGHRTPDSRIQISINYQDGFGRSLQTKSLVEPEPDETALRWLTSGHTVYNNKQQVVRQFEPYFRPSPEFESDEALERFGNSTLTHYDALGRQIHVKFPNGTRTWVEISSWQTRQFDPNDTVVGSDYEDEREAITDENDPEKKALRKAQAHNDTPVTIHLDPLGREYMTEVAGTGGLARRTTTDLDGLGNPRLIRDARELEAFIYRRDLLGRVFYERSVDAGEKWQFPNALNQAIHVWDGQGVHQKISYDRLGRIAQIGVDGALDMNHLTERYVYGDDPDDPEIADASRRNLRGQLFKQFDQAGIMYMERYDLAGNILHRRREIIKDYKAIPNWTDPDAVELLPAFETRITYDALARIKQENLPDSTTRKFIYHQSGAIKQMLLTTADGVHTDLPILQNTIYNARGQRTEATLGNGVTQQYEYHARHYRLSRLTARRPAVGGQPARLYQDLHYTYDPAGNITYCNDLAQQADSDVIHGLPVSAHKEYTYDAFYQLIDAQGRVHLALEANDYAHAPDAPGFIKGTRHFSLDNGAIVRRFRRTYDYDLNGNLRAMVHHTIGLTASEDNTWRRNFWISTSSNRSLPATDLNGIPITDPESRFDANGNCKYLPHLRGIKWDYRNQLAQAVIIEREDEPDDAEYYVYGADSQRVRKVHERISHDQLEITEKIYLDGCEIKRIHLGGELILERTTSHLSDGNQRLALLHQWSKDDLGRETDNIADKKFHYQLTDHLGSATLELSEHGEVISYEEFFPFGCSAFIAGDSERDIRLKDYRYSGKERDDATGFYYYGYRYYAPWLARWLTPDPIGPEDSLNLYEFVHNNPIILADPNGLSVSHTVLTPDQIDRRFFLEENRNRLHAGDILVVYSPGGNISAGEYVSPGALDAHLHAHLQRFPADLDIELVYQQLPEEENVEVAPARPRRESRGTTVNSSDDIPDTTSSANDPFERVDFNDDDPLAGLDLEEINDEILGEADPLEGISDKDDDPIAGLDLEVDDIDVVNSRNAERSQPKAASTNEQPTPSSTSQTRPLTRNERPAQSSTSQARSGLRGAHGNVVVSTGDDDLTSWGFLKGWGLGIVDFVGRPITKRVEYWENYNRAFREGDYLSAFGNLASTLPIYGEMRMGVEDAISTYESLVQGADWYGRLLEGDPSAANFDLSRYNPEDIGRVYGNVSTGVIVGAAVPSNWLSGVLGRFSPTQRLLAAERELAMASAGADDAVTATGRLASIGDDAATLADDAAAAAEDAATTTNNTIRGAAGRPPSDVELGINSAAPQMQIEDAVALAREAGIDIPDYVRFVADDAVTELAEYGQIGTLHQGRGFLEWEDFLTVNDEFIVRVRPDVLTSPRAIIATFAHEAHEIRLLEQAFFADKAMGRLPRGQVWDLIRDGLGGNLHDQAWNYARRMLAETFRR